MSDDSYVPTSSDDSYVPASSDEYLHELYTTVQNQAQWQFFLDERQRLQTAELATSNASDDAMSLGEESVGSDDVTPTDFDVALGVDEMVHDIIHGQGPCGHCLVKDIEVQLVRLELGQVKAELDVFKTLVKTANTAVHKANAKAQNVQDGLKLALEVGALVAECKIPPRPKMFLDTTARLVSDLHRETQDIVTGLTNGMDGLGEALGEDGDDKDGDDDEDDEED
ncbi:hypothetical protein R3P38DRAFT_2813571 [Favolaschia claudopus]|uniref:Uncharacterized protein n=1 Tax=Favolaschia claudopus TaxID=2862362 RepID=A0AAV9Z4Y7_9AGAR